MCICPCIYTNFRKVENARQSEVFLNIQTSQPYSTHKQRTWKFLKAFWEISSSFFFFLLPWVVTETSSNSSRRKTNSWCWKCLSVSVYLSSSRSFLKAISCPTNNYQYIPRQRGASTNELVIPFPSTTGIKFKSFSWARAKISKKKKKQQTKQIKREERCGRSKGFDTPLKRKRRARKSWVRKKKNILHVQSSWRWLTVVGYFLSMSWLT